ncbi:MAG: hypothetical protein KDA93_11785 [Planctomycetaceae bacterium]|nr:hypothetical protein [Planctomycetaceae bacterium]
MIRRLHFAFLSLFALSALSTSHADAQIADVPTAFNEIDVNSRVLNFEAGDVPVPVGGHWQGIQMRRDADGDRSQVFLSHDSATTAYIYVVEFSDSLDVPGRIIHRHEFSSDGDSPPLRHSGGIQLVEDVLVVGVEDNQRKTRSEVQFWEVSDPTKFRQLTHVTVQRRGEPKAQTAGAVGMVKQGDGHILAVANWDSRAIDFYVSNEKPLLDPECRFTHERQWSAERADISRWNPGTAFGSHQAIQLLADVSGTIYLIGFHTDSQDAERADLFLVDLQQPVETMLRQVSSREVTLNDGIHFRYAAGLWVDQSKLHFLASERNLQPLTRLMITGSKSH